jgi:signal transduction histidine kinase
MIAPEPAQPQPAPPVPANEEARLAALERYRIDGLGREQAFDHLAALAKEMFDVPTSLVTIIGSDTQCIRGATGGDLLYTGRDVAFCAYTILSDDVLVIPDARKDPRVRDNPYVTNDPNLRFYAGAPLVVEGGFALGSLCLIDTEPRDLDSAERNRLQQLARTGVDLIEMRVERFIAEQQRQALSEERERLSAAIGHLDEGVALFDAERRLLVRNAAFATLLGCPQDRLKPGIGDRQLFKSLTPIGSFADAEVAAIVSRLIAPHEPVAHVEIARADGRILQGRRRRSASGQFVLTLRDVTDDRQAARLKDELVSTVSHELRTPLAAISGTLELLGSDAAGELPAKAQPLLAIAAKNVERLKLLVDDLLDLDKLESGAAGFHFARCDLAQLLRDAAAENQPFAERFNVTFDLHLPQEQLVIEGDRLRLCQVMTNLFSNAVKFSPAGGTVRLSLRQSGAQAIITVADEGPGVPPAFRDRLFTRFAQAEGARPAGHASTGLGLAISKVIAEAHGGTIALDDRAGLGASFVVQLPIARAHADGNLGQ